MNTQPSNSPLVEVLRVLSALCAECAASGGRLSTELVVAGDSAEEDDLLVYAAKQALSAGEPLPDGLGADQLRSLLADHSLKLVLKALSDRTIVQVDTLMHYGRDAPGSSLQEYARQRGTDNRLPRQTIEAGIVEKADSAADYFRQAVALVVERRDDLDAWT